MITAKDCAYCVFKGVIAGALKGLFKYRGRLPPRVERRVNASFLYWVGSMGLTTGGVVLASNVLHYVDLRNCKPVWVVIGSGSAIIGSWLLCRYAPYDPRLLSKKHAAWAVHCGAVGSVVAIFTPTECGPFLQFFAGYCTLIIVRGYYNHAFLSPGVYLNWGRNLGIGLGMVTVSSLAACFTSSDNSLRNVFMSISTAGGLSLFTIYVLHHTQKLVAKAEANNVPFDPINE